MAISGRERREQIIKILNSSETPVAGTELAKELGVSNGMISNWENDVNEPGLSHIKNIAIFFDVSADYIVGTK